MELLAEQFNGLKVLLKRENLKDELLTNYLDSVNQIKKLKDNEKTTRKERFKQKNIESLFAYPKVFNKLSKKEKNDIISNSKEAAKKMKVRNITQTEYNTFGLEAKYALEPRDPGALEPGDNIKTGTIYTPMGSAIPVAERVDFTDQEKEDMDFEMAWKYPNAIKVRSATYKYNCHSYAWYSTSTYNKWWVEIPSPYMTDGSYTEVGLYPTKRGQVMYYPVPGGHSAIIDTPAENYLDMWVTSKWGPYGLYRHAAYHSPYSPYEEMTTYWERN